MGRAEDFFGGGSHLLEIGKGGLPKFLTDEEGGANFFSSTC